MSLTTIPETLHILQCEPLSTSFQYIQLRAPEPIFDSPACSVEVEAGPPDSGDEYIPDTDDEEQAKEDCAFPELRTTTTELAELVQEEASSEGNNNEVQLTRKRKVCNLK